MTLDLALPVYRNLKCLAVAWRGLLACLPPQVQLRTVLLHIQDPLESGNIQFIFGDRFPVKILSVGGSDNMAQRMDRMFSQATSDWLLFTEQDVFLELAFFDHLIALARDGFDLVAPVDTLFYDHPNARGRPFYGTYGRLSPPPGYFHSSLIALRRNAVRSPSPFSLPDGFKLAGYGVLGGESYYGLRVTFEREGNRASPIAFLRQQHGAYGYSAELRFNQAHLATHLYYSSTRDGYLTNGSLSPDDAHWLGMEEHRFLIDYIQRILGGKP